MAAAHYFIMTPTSAKANRNEKVPFAHAILLFPPSPNARTELSKRKVALTHEHELSAHVGAPMQLSLPHAFMDMALEWW